MAAEVLAAYKWTALHVARYGGDPSNISVMGHSAGGHLGSLALLMLAQQKHLAAQTQQQQQQQQQQQPHQQQCEAIAAAPVLGQQGSMLNVQQQQQQQHQQQGRQLPAQQLQQRAEVAAAEALHHQHHVHPQPQQQQHLPWLPEHDGPQWSSLGAGIMSVPVPAAFIGMSSVYDIGRHFEFESLRGVAGISTMGRACGGAVNFDAISPAAILRRAAASAGDGCSSKGRRCHAVPQHSTRGQAVGQSSRATEQQQQQQHGVQQAAPHGPVLLGEVIPYRSGLDGRSAEPHSPPRANSHAANGTNAAGKQHDGKVAGSTSTGSSGTNSLTVPGVVACSTSAVLASFCAPAAKYMPPCILMSR